MEIIKENENNILREKFEKIDPDSRLYIYLNYNAESTDEEICASVERARGFGVGCIIPVYSGDDFDYIHPMRLLRFYGALLEKAESVGIKVMLNLEKHIEKGMVEYFEESGESVRSRVLLRREYFCSNEENVKIPIGDDVISIVAIEENGELKDLRPFVSNGELNWKSPRGNWKVCRYFCSDDDEHNDVNMLNYDMSSKYVETVMTLFRDNFPEHIGKTLCGITFSDVCFTARNRRNWDETYNEFFMKKYGFDPAPFYPCLYDCGEVEFRHYKAVLMACRAEMLEKGFMSAVSDTAEKYGMIAVGSIAEPKITAASWVTGDAVLAQIHSPCAVLEKAYLYGMNSVKISSGAADMSEHDTVSCEIFRDYANLDYNIIYRETMTAFARGANRLMAHLPENIPQKSDKGLFGLFSSDGKSDYAEYVGKIQTVLGGGKQVSDIMLLYPIYSLHSRVCLYDAPINSERFEYPDTPDITDYMTVINSIYAYSGLDLTVVHPECLNRMCRAEDGKIVFDGKHSYSVAVIPATEMISVGNLRKIADFYDGGGKVIASGALPKTAFELSDNENDYDAEVLRLTEHIFGRDAVSGNISCDYSYNSNENGGEAYFLYSTATGSDRTYHVSGERLLRSIMSFDVPYDVLISDMPRLECTGALNNDYPEYKMLGLDREIKGGGMFSHIHKQKDGSDIYFFANATDIPYCGDVFIKGKHRLEEWSVNGKTKKLKCEYITQRGAEYTKIRLSLESGESTLIVSDRNFSVSAL